MGNQKIMKYALWIGSNVPATYMDRFFELSGVPWSFISISIYIKLFWLF